MWLVSMAARVREPTPLCSPEYNDDVNNGEEFTSSGSGGRDLSGNKRTAKQSMDQKLTAMNR